MPDDPGLQFGPLEPGTVHLCIDMQRLFAEGTPWHTPWLGRVLPKIVLLAERAASDTIFTRFVPPTRPSQARGAWRRYYERWRNVTGERIDPSLLELVAPLQRLVPPAAVVDKTVYSAFRAPGLAALLAARRCRGLVITGGETDVCVLATALDAVDRGYRVVLPIDGLCSSQDLTHDALITLYRCRFGQQIECTTIGEALEAWPR